MDEPEAIPVRVFLRKCRSALWRRKVADSTGQELTGGQLLTAAFAFARLLQRRSLAAEEKRVGLLLPPSVGGLLANVAVTLTGRVAVNLNYTLSSADLNYCLDQAEVKHVLTSRRFLERKPVSLAAEFIYLEDLKSQVTWLEKSLAAAQAYLVPVRILESIYRLQEIEADEVMTVIFTSGSTGRPKGVMLSHRNVGTNIQAAEELLRFGPDDILLGILPFFHSFGYTLTLWLALNVDSGAVYHMNPLEARRVGDLCRQYGVTILAATPTFLKSYLKRCTPEQMQTVELAIVGAEKCPRELAEAFHEKFGIWPTEGYGATELSPLVACNVPDHRLPPNAEKRSKAGTVGRLIPGVRAKIVDPESGQEVPTGEEGLLLIRGPGVMLGYLNQPEKTAEKVRDGWYDTGDIARIDEDGFLEITGRQSRFAKIGGEMVPQLKIEEALNQILGHSETDEEDVRLVVTSLPDPERGERLVVLHKPLPKPVAEVVEKLGELGLPNLWIPEPQNFIEVDSIPLTGTGKLDLKAIQTLAREQVEGTR